MLLPFLQRRLVVSSRLTTRLFSHSATIRQEGNLFGSLTKNVNLDKESQGKLSSRLMDAAESTDSDNKNDIKDSITVENDERLQKYIVDTQQPERLPTDLYLSPLKKKLYKANCAINGGFYKRDTVITLPSNGNSYRLKLSKNEIDALEPSVYLKSYRLKSSMKKTTQVLRLINGLDLKKAISQCQFSQRHVAREVGELLMKGIEDAEKLKLDPNDLYISQIWTGSDGSWMKRIEWKARGRMGVIKHPYVHVRCILKTKSVTKKRLEYEAKAKQQRQKPWVQLADKPVRGVTNNVYKW